VAIKASDIFLNISLLMHWFWMGGRWWWRWASWISQMHSSAFTRTTCNIYPCVMSFCFTLLNYPLRFFLYLLLSCTWLAVVSHG